MERDRWVKAGLWFLAIQGGFVGVWALFFPGSFFSGFPGYGRSWVSAIGEFNEHLVTDVGAFNLAFAVLFAAAAYLLDAKLTLAAAGSYLVFAIPHLSFHLMNRGDLGALDVALQNASLLLIVAIAGWLAWNSRGALTAARNG